MLNKIKMPPLVVRTLDNCTKNYKFKLYQLNGELGDLRGTVSEYCVITCIKERSTYKMMSAV